MSIWLQNSYKQGFENIFVKNCSQAKNTAKNWIYVNRLKGGPGRRISTDRNRLRNRARVSTYFLLWYISCILCMFPDVLPSLNCVFFHFLSIFFQSFDLLPRLLFRDWAFVQFHHENGRTSSAKLSVYFAYIVWILRNPQLFQWISMYITEVSKLWKGHFPTPGSTLSPWKRRFPWSAEKGLTSVLLWCNLTMPPAWWNGRHRGLKIPCPRGRAGSNPAAGTKPI